MADAGGSRTLTFLFTDIEGSTRLWEQHGDAMRHALAQHDELLRDSVETRGGAVVKTTGDGMLAVFDEPAVAIAAAIDAQRALDAAVWGDTGALRVRMAVHCGPATERDGDYYGTTLNRAARLMALAHGGQIVASEAIALLVRDETLAHDAKLRDLGEHRLRDLSHVERVYQIDAAGLAGDFAPLRSLDSYSTNLPSQLTSFVGRDDEIKALITLVRRAPTRHAHRRRWCREDASRVARRGRAAPGGPRRCVGVRARGRGRGGRGARDRDACARRGSAARHVARSTASSTTSADATA